MSCPPTSDTWWILVVVLQALALGWLVALVDAFWKLRQILTQVRRSSQPDDQHPERPGETGERD
jgi:hypothetical protein